MCLFTTTALQTWYNLLAHQQSFSIFLYPDNRIYLLMQALHHSLLNSSIWFVVFLWAFSLRHLLVSHPWLGCFLFSWCIHTSAIFINICCYVSVVVKFFYLYVVSYRQLLIFLIKSKNLLETFTLKRMTKKFSS